MMRDFTAIILAALLLAAPPLVFAQGGQAASTPGQDKTPGAASPAGEKPPPNSVFTVGGVSQQMQANRRESPSEEEAAILPYYNNFLSTYRLGPEDVISITIFGQERYSRTGIVVPPTGRIAYPLIKGGIQVAGKTVDQVQEEITKQLEEYIIEPKVTVSLDQARSARYSVLGDVAQPGVKPMTRRLTVYEALTDAGGVLRTGNKKKVYLLRRQANGVLQPTIIDVTAIEKGKAPDITYLVPGDQILVPGNTLKRIQEVLSFTSVLSFAWLFR
jgi:polysaccharide export outer membrane protein